MILEAWESLNHSKNEVFGTNPNALVFGCVAWGLKTLARTDEGDELLQRMAGGPTILLTMAAAVSAAATTMTGRLGKA